MSPRHILLVEDDENLGFVLHETLEMHGYRVTRMGDGVAGLAAFQNESFDLCLLDVMLPHSDGFTLAKGIRQSDSEVPIIFLTAKSMKEDRIEGFRLGGDDYVTKPFSMEELLLRIQAVLKRSRRGQPEAASGPRNLGRYAFDPARQSLKLENQERRLTHKESALLDLLSRKPDQLVKRDEALTAIWGEETFFTGRSMDVYISRLRKALQGDPDLEIVNVHGEGYKLLVHRN